MLKMSRFVSMMAVVAAVGVGSAAEGAPIIAGTTSLYSRAIQDITLLPGTLLNPTGDPVLIKDLYGDGVITIHRDAQVGSTITFASLSGGQYYGSNAMVPGNYVFGNIPPLTGADFSGSITNVVQDPLDPGYATGQPSSFVSGDFQFGGASFGFMFLDGPFAGLAVYTDPTVPFAFSAHFDGLPPSLGTVLVNSGTNVLNIKLGGVTVATSSNRRILIVPEPASLAMVGLGVLAVAAMARGRLRS